jgi:hypothetical protein
MLIIIHIIVHFFNSKNNNLTIPTIEVGKMPSNHNDLKFITTIGLGGKLVVIES